MSSKPLSPIRKTWYRWKTLRLPWRKRFLVGLDLYNNTFWEFRDSLAHTHRMRRIVQSPPSVQYSDLKISPQWHQWLRYTRHDPPTIEELSQDVARQERLKILARQADERWAAKPSFLDQPGERRGQPLPATKVLDPGGYAGQNTKPNEKDDVRNMVAGIEEVEATEAKKMQVPDGVRHPVVGGREHNAVRKDDIVKPKEKADPWKQARGGPSEEWKPKAWDANIAVPRR